MKYFTLHTHAIFFLGSLALFFTVLLALSPNTLPQHRQLLLLAFLYITFATYYYTALQFVLFYVDSIKEVYKKHPTTFDYLFKGSLAVILLSILFAVTGKEVVLEVVLGGAFFYFFNQSYRSWKKSKIKTKNKSTRTRKSDKS